MDAVKTLPARRGLVLGTAFATLGLGALLWFSMPRLEGGIGHALERPKCLWLALVLPTVYATAWCSLASVPGWQRLLMGTTRSALLFTLMIVLAGPSAGATTEARCTVMLVDVSPSVPDETLGHAEDWANRYARLALSGDVILRVAFDATPRIVREPFTRARSPLGQGEASDYGSAMDFAAGLCAGDLNRQLVMFGDGLDTHAGLLEAADRLRALGFSLSVLPSRAPPPADVAVGPVAVQGDVQLGRPFRVSVDLHATRPTEVEFEFELDAAPNPRESRRKTWLSAGSSHIEFESQVNHAHAARFRVTAVPSGPDAVSQNNSATAVVEVTGPPKLLHVEGRHERGAAFDAALSAQRFAVERVGPAGFPTNVEALRQYVFIVLSDVRRSELGEAAARRIEQAVREFGVGLLFAGGQSSYAAGGWSGSVVERMLPVTMAVAEHQDVTDVALVLVIDRSGSMSGLPLEMAKAACAATVEALRTTDRIEVIAFDAKPVRYVSMQKARTRAAIANDLTRILAGGDTELFPALDMAYQDLLATEARRKHVILLTDGQSPKAGLTEIVQNLVAESITLTIVGLGPDVDTELLQYLAGRGGGRYHAATDPKTLPRIFTREAESLKQLLDTHERFEVMVRQRASFMRGVAMEQAPFLHGYSRTQRRSKVAEVLLESDRVEPILARSRYGAGWALAWTSDLQGPWAVEWARWADYGRFFAQLLRQHQRQPGEEAPPMQTELRGNRLRVTVDAVTGSGEFDNDRSIVLNVEGPEATRSIELVLECVAPGLYEATTLLPSLGDYRLHLTQKRFDETGQLQTIGESRGQVSLSYPVEFQELAPNLQLLERVAQIGHGSFEPSVELAQSTPRMPTLVRRPNHESWLLGALVVFLLDLLCKRWRFRQREVVIQ